MARAPVAPDGRATAAPSSRDGADTAPNAAPAPVSALAATSVPVYAWAPTSKEALATRFPEPAGFTRVVAPARSFAAFLRTLPLAPPGTPVRSYRGESILAGDDPRLAAVVDIDIGRADLQQCADSIIRMHAEWRRHEGRGDVTYKASSGFAMSYARYSKGDRFRLQGNDLAWTHNAAPDDSRASFRSYLDQVFSYANTVSIARDAKSPSRGDVQPGDFFVLPGGPGHAVLILDIAVDANGKKRALMGQGYMPAQSFHVLRDSATSSAWYSFEGERVATPFWAPFPWTALRRFD